MIVKMKFLSISGPKNDIDRVCEVYLSKYEMQLENAAAELKTTDNLQPFVEINPYKEPLAKAEQFSALLADEDQRIDVLMNQEDMLNLIRDVNHDYLDLLEKKELTKKQVEEYKEKLLIMEPFRTLELDMQKSLKYKYMKVRFGRVDVNYYKRLEKYLFDDLNAVFIEGTRNENYVYGCYFVSNADSSKVDSVFNSLHFERIAIPSEYIGTPEQACEELEKAIEEKQKEIAEIDRSLQDQKYQLRCRAAIDLLTAKLNMINADLSRKKRHVVINQISSRVKTAESIYTKLIRKGLEPDFDTARAELKDLIGIRVVCPFEDEVYEVADRLKAQGDVQIIREKDYIKNPKKNGYKSLHMIVEVPIYSSKGPLKEKVEIQLRTVAMDYWSVLEYQIFYKKTENEEVAKELKTYADEISELDAKMLKLRDKIEKM